MLYELFSACSRNIMFCFQIKEQHILQIFWIKRTDGKCHVCVVFWGGGFQAAHEARGVLNEMTNNRLNDPCPVNVIVFGST